MNWVLVVTWMAFVTGLRFIRQVVTETEATDYTATKAERHVDLMFGKLIKVSGSNNPLTKYAVENLTKYSRKILV